MQIGVLGPLEVRCDMKNLTPTAPKLRVVLALLAMSPNRVVSAETLIDELWGNNPPQTAATTLHTHMYQLRRAMWGSDGASRTADLILTRPPGYVVRIPAQNIDAEQHMALAQRGRQALESGDPESAVTLLRSALAMWRGEPLAGVTAGAVLTAHKARLEESRLSTLGQRIAADLKLKRHGEVISELGALTAEHPLNERFHSQLMVAMHRSGRRAEALDVYQRLRGVLVRELGLEPSVEVGQIHQAILRAEDGMEWADLNAASVTVTTAPAQLAPDIADFTGRADEVARLEALLGSSQAEPHNAPKIAVVTGMPGVGKTTFAVHVAHRVRSRYPDGQLYASLRTPDGAPASASFNTCDTRARVSPTLAASSSP